jgi:hypothetical protein
MTTIELRGGHETSDRRLDRIPDFDERSRNFRAVALVPTTELRSKTWGLSWLLDQGEQGACTNFGLAHNRLGSPKPIRLPIVQDTGAEPSATGFAIRPRDAEQLAFKLYGRSKQLDPFPGEEYEGTTMLAAAKAWREAKLLGSFRWCFGIDELLITLARLGPVVLASDWLDSMFDPGPNGLLDVTGRFAGGHAYDATGVVLHPERSSVWRDTGVKGEPLIVGPNSWGPRRSPWERPSGPPWGRNGYWAMRASSVERLLKGVKYGGEACVPLDRPLAA